MTGFRKLLRKPGLSTIRQRRLTHEPLEPRHLLAAGVIVSPKTITVVEGKTKSITVKLQEAPTADVLVILATNNTAEAFLSTNALTFTPQNWRTPQKVTVFGTQDLRLDGDKAVTLVVESVSADMNYSALLPQSLTTRVKDSKATPFSVKALTKTTSEADTVGKKAFSVKLNAQPVATVTIPIRSSNVREGMPIINSISFTTANWSVPQVVFVQGVDDALPDSNVQYSIINDTAESEDERFAGQKPNDVTLTNKAVYYAALYDGTYTGSFTGLASGTIDRVTITDGIVDVDIDVLFPVTGEASGGGTVSASGKFSVKAGGVIAGAVFKGTIKLSADRRSLVGTGTWKHPLGAGTWQISRELEPDA